MSAVTIEGYSVEELFELPDEQFDAFVLRDEPFIFQVGSAKVLGRVTIQNDTLVLELAHIDGGGEGVLVTLVSVAKRFGLRRGLAFLEWRIHAVSCATPNLRLRKLLEHRGFTLQDVPEVGKCYFFREPLLNNRSVP